MLKKVLTMVAACVGTAAIGAIAGVSTIVGVSIGGKIINHFDKEEA